MDGRTKIADPEAPDAINQRQRPAESEPLLSSAENWTGVAESFANTKGPGWDAQ
ncbi:hypothetical protein HTZ77_29865 [Nonomuraea sp. SMC257]|uniref:Uncharacterized protein n=1 Tax=Nonomuraea montanisoli TaxID=2741721 RepID=A0A7Y6ICC7_9ACTN|nr:hypothetical protein [Nonomuraea montanisoli]NUW35607.1 hypothetical protein [Nonomuraea montanisoli]